MTKFIVILIAFFSCSVNLSAEDKVIKCKLSIVSLTRLVKNEKLLTCVDVDGKILCKIAASSSAIPRATDYKGPKVFQLCSDDNGKLTAIATISLKENQARTIILLTPSSEESESKYRAAMIDGSLANFSSGSRLFFNFTKLPMRGEIGELPFVRGGEKNIRFTCNSINYSALRPLNRNAKPLSSQPVILEYLQNNKWIKFMESKWFHQPGSRKIVFTYFDRKRNKVMVKSVSETLNTPEDVRDIAANAADVSPSKESNDEISHPIYGKEKEKGIY